MIFITVDLIDSRNTNIDVALAFIDQINELAPIYYVNGNHESRVNEYDDLITGLNKLGVHDLNNATTTIIINDATITLIGLADPSFNKQSVGFNYVFDPTTLTSLVGDDQNYKILLAHRPELFDQYLKSNIDLIYSGHAHGGQIILPFIGPIAAPDQGLFPGLTQGVYTEENSSLVVSRGLGNSLIPFKINNRPELVVTTFTSPINYILKHKKNKLLLVFFIPY